MGSNNDELKKQTASGLFWQFLEKIAAELVTLIVSIVLGRILLPSDYGTIGLITVFISIFSVFATSGFSSALIQKIDADKLDFYSALYASIFIGLLIFGAIYLLAPSIADFYSDSSLIPLIRYMGLQIPILSVRSIETAYVAKNFMFKKFFFATIIGTVLSGIIGIYMAYNDFGPWAICTQTITNMLIDSIALAILIRKPVKCIFSFTRIRAMWSFSCKILISGLIDSVYMNIKSLVIGKKYTEKDLAFYTKGEQFPKLIANNITATIESVFFPTLAREQKSVDTVLHITRRFAQVSTYLMFPMLIGMASIADTLIPFLLTEKWNSSILYLQIVCFVFLFNPLQVATIQPVKALGKAGTYLKIEITKKIIGILTLIFVMNKGVVTIACSALVLTVINWIINAIFAKKVYRYSITNQVCDFLPNLVLSLSMGVIVYLMNYMTLVASLRLILQLLIGILIYVGLSYVTKNPSFKYVWGYLKEIKGQKNGEKVEGEK